MSKVKCALCEQLKEEGACEVLTLTDAEKAAVKDAPDRYVYCRPCWRILNDPVNGLALMKGLVQAKLRSLGVSGDRAEAAAQEFQKKLMSRSTRRPS
jgi:hypothetical protein